MNRSLVFDLATAGFIAKREDALFLGPGGTGKSHLAQAIGQAAIQQGYRVLYRETHVLLDDLAEAIAEGTRKEFMETLTTVPLLIIDDFGMRKLPHTAAEDLLEIVMRRYERFSTLLTSNRLCGAPHKIGSTNPLRGSRLSRAFCTPMAGGNCPCAREKRKASNEPFCARSNAPAGIQEIAGCLVSRVDFWDQPFVEGSVYRCFHEQYNSFRLPHSHRPQGFCLAPTDDRRHDGAQLCAQHADQLPAAGQPLRTPLRQVTGAAGPRRDPRVPDLPGRPEKGGGGHPHRRRQRAALSLRCDLGARVDCAIDSCAQKGPSPARHSQSRRDLAVAAGGSFISSSRHFEHHVWHRHARQRGGSSARRRYR